jgi:RNA polymerase sigma factor (sigma-70 family)
MGVRNNVSSAAEDIYSRFRHRFVLFARQQYSLTREDAKDIFQDTVIAFYENVRSGKLTHLNASLKTYLFQIGKHKIINFQKKNVRKESFHERDLSNSVSGPDEIEEKGQADFIRTLVADHLAKQCADCREVLLMYYFEGMSMREIAEKMGFANAAVAKKKKFDCFHKLAKILKETMKHSPLEL